jgi:hypothetical protein
MDTQKSSVLYPYFVSNYRGSYIYARVYFFFQGAKAFVSSDYNSGIHNFIFAGIRLCYNSFFSKIHTCMVFCTTLVFHLTLKVSSEQLLSLSVVNFVHVSVTRY